MNNEECACLNVMFMPVELPDGKKEERWMCLECKSIFKKEKSGNVPQAASRNAVLGEVEPFKKICSDGSFNISCRCGYLFLHGSFKYCPECGIKLSWRNFA